jgi:hypothetical protein
MSSNACLLPPRLHGTVGSTMSNIRGDITFYIRLKLMFLTKIFGSKPVLKLDDRGAWDISQARIGVPMASCATAKRTAAKMQQALLDSFLDGFSRKGSLLHRCSFKPPAGDIQAVDFDDSHAMRGIGIQAHDIPNAEIHGALLLDWSIMRKA